MSTKHDYTLLDAAIQARLSLLSPVGFAALCVHPDVKVESRKIADLVNQGSNRRSFDQAEPWRIIDRRLQVLRKAGKIRYQRKSAAHPEGWVVV